MPLLLHIVSLESTRSKVKEPGQRRIKEDVLATSLSEKSYWQERRGPHMFATVRTQGTEGGWRTSNVFVNSKHRPCLRAELNQSPRSQTIALGAHAFPTYGARKKQHLSRGSRVKTYSDICFGGHPIPARINVLPPFNFTWAGAKSKHSRRVITLLCLDQLVTGLWTPQKSAQGNYSLFLSKYPWETPSHPWWLDHVLWKQFSLHRVWLS